MAVTYLEIDGGKLAVEADGEGPLVVCAHGMGDTRDAYDPLATALVAAGYKVVRFDLRGHGDSTATFKHYGDEAIADDFLAVIKAFGGGPAVLAGASMSAAASVIAAGRQPELVCGFILIGAFLRVGAGKALMMIMRLALLRPWGPAFWGTYSATLWPGLPDGGKKRANDLIEQMKRPGRWNAFQATVAGAKHEVCTPYLGKVQQVPALVVIGDSDPDWSDPVAEAKWVASNFNDSEIITVAGAGHAPMYEKPDDVTPGVLKFLEKVKSSQARWSQSA